MTSRLRAALSRSVTQVWPARRVRSCGDDPAGSALDFRSDLLQGFYVSDVATRSDPLAHRLAGWPHRNTDGAIALAAKLNL